MKSVNTLLISCIFAFTASAHAETKYYPDQRTQLPAALNNSYIGLGAAYTDFPFSNRNLINGIQATSFTNPTFGLTLFLGHYFNPYVAGEISLMRPIKWSYAKGIVKPSDKHSIWISVFGFSLRPTLPITDRFNLYGITGLGLISRHGFSINQTVGIPSEVVPTLLTGGGFSYALTQYWHLNVGLEYTLARPEKQQPNTWYTFGGFYYLFHKLHLPKYYTTNYIFQKNCVQIGGFSTDVFNPNVNKYFSVRYLPVFWTGDLKTNNGGWVMYERNVFHTHKRFSLNVGASIATYNSLVNKSSFQAFSVFPQIRVWIVRAPTADFYFTYSVAGPTYLTQDYIDNIYLGGQFTFQDLLGFGFFLGKEKHLNVDFSIGHYSNGNSLPNNPGVQVPLVVSLGYAFE